MEFSFSTTANSDKGIMVKGQSDFSASDAIEKFEYLESKDGKYYPLAVNAPFGPDSGFPMSDATSKFRVTFKKAGTYTFAASMSGVDNGEVLCKTEEISITVYDKYDVSLMTNEGGTATINNDTKSFRVVENSDDATVAINATPDDGYRIKSVKANEVSLTVANAYSFSENYTVTKDTVITVEFEKIYTVAVKAGENGIYEADPNIAVDDILTVADGTNIKITAKAAENYRIISAKLIKGKDTTTYELERNAAVKEVSFSANDDYEVQFEFALKEYNVSVVADANGTASANAEVDHGSDVKVTVTPDNGYTIDEITLNNTVITPELSTSDGKDITFTLSAVAADAEIGISFGQCASAEASDISWNSDKALRRVDADKLFVFAKNNKSDSGTTANKVVFTTEKDGLRITANGTVMGGFGEKTIEVTENIDIAKIEVYYDLGWHAFGEDQNYSIKFDGAQPAVAFSVDAEKYSTEKTGGYYTHDFEINVTAEDGKNDSKYWTGIQKVEYQIIDPEANVSDKWNALSFNNGGKAGDKKVTGVISVSAEDHDFDGVKVIVKVTDKAGNERIYDAAPDAEGNVDKAFGFSVSYADPMVTVSFVSETKDNAASDGWYQARTLRITVTDRADTFVPENVILTNKENKTPISLSGQSWINNNDGTNSVTIGLGEGNYGFTVDYTNKAAKEANQVAPADFGVDATAPEGKVGVNGASFEKLREFVNKITFGLFAKSGEISTFASANDNLSGIKETVYYMQAIDMNDGEETAPLTKAELDALYAENAFSADPETVSTDNAFAVYVRFLDHAGNVQYVCSNGVIYDSTNGIISIAPTAPKKNSIYGDADVAEYTQTYGGKTTVKKGIPVKVTVKDPDPSKNKNGVSGIKSVKYDITGMTSESGTVFTYNKTDSKKSDLVREFSFDLIVDAEKFNGQTNTNVKITVLDNAGNEYAENTSLNLINIDALEGYVESDDEAVTLQEGYGWFGAARKFKITVTDRSFDTEAATAAVKVKINGQTVEPGNDTYTVGTWSHKGGNWDTTVTFLADGKYEWTFDYANLPGNKLTAENINAGETVSPYSFTIDTAAPSGKITLNNHFWTELLKTISFGLYNKTAPAFSITAADADELSPITIEYYIASDDAAIDKTALEGYYNTGKFTAYDKEKLPSLDGQFTVYARITDNANNCVYLSSDGYIVDDDPSSLVLKAVTTASGSVHNNNKIYSSADVAGNENKIDVSWAANEEETNYAGIKNITYSIKANGGSVSEEGTLYSFGYSGDYSNGTLPVKAELKQKDAGIIKVDAEKFNFCDTVVTVTVTDNADNVTQKTLPLDIDVTAPTVSVKFSGPDAVGEKYYKGSRSATVTFIERADHFDKTAAAKNIVITSADSTGKSSAVNYTDAWTEKNDTFTANINFTNDANYTFEIKDAKAPTTAYTDMAGNTAATLRYDFTVDTTDPAAVITVNESKWTKLLNTITFGLYDNVKAEIAITATDNTTASDVINGRIEYAVGTGESDDISTLEFVKYKAPFAYTSDKQFVIYARVTDLTGNTVTINSDGFIVDTTLPEAPVLSVDKGKLEELPDIFGMNNIPTYDLGEETVSGIKVDISVNENSGIYSGIKSIDYTVADAKDAKNIKVTDSGNLFTFAYEREAGDGSGADTNGGSLRIDAFGTEPIVKSGSVPDKKDLVTSWEGYIIVDPAKNNSSFTVVTVTVTDNAGNKKSENITLDIDLDKPVIDISYDNNTCINEKFFMAKKNAEDEPVRIATVNVTERKGHFNSAKATDGIVITAKDIYGEDVENAYILSNWSKVPGGKDPYKETYEATITYKADANYTFAMTYTGNSGNAADAPVYAKGTQAPEDFTIDTVAPERAEIKIVERVWSKFLSVITFGLYTNTKADVTIENPKDATSEVAISYFKTNDPVALTKEDLDKKTFIAYEPFTVKANEQFIVYAKLTDKAGNYTYINSDGVIVDAAPSLIEWEYTEANANGVYNGNVDFTLNISDAEPYSGIAKIEYWVVCDGKETQRQTLYSFNYARESGDANTENTNGGALVICDWATGVEQKSEYNGNVPLHDMLKKAWKGSFTVDINKNNSSDVDVFVEVTDNAGNVSSKQTSLDMDKTAPVIKVTYADTANENAKEGYFTSRTATVEITERTKHFSAKAATAGITITAVNAKGETISGGYTISGWTTAEGETPDDAVHTATITYAADANYTFAVEYTDNADNKAADADVFGQTAPFRFTVDKTSPTGTITAISENTDNSSRTETWNAIVSNLVFGFWSNNKIAISSTSTDATSPIMSVEYYMPVSVNAKEFTTALTKAQLDEVTEWKSFSEFDVKANTQFVVYIKITDNAGNYTYVSTNGLLVDSEHPLDESVAPEISANPEKPVNGIYSDNVKVAITVTDPEVNGAYSGLKEVSYAVFNRASETPDKPTQEGKLFEFTKANPKQSELQQQWTGEITVDKTKNNSNDIQIVVYAIDNSLNYIDNSQSNSQSYCVIKIDTTAPVIEVSYDNNSADSGTYFKANRTATVKITERNFNSKDVKITITNTDGVIPALTPWKTEKGTLNNDNTVNTATIVYSADGDYTFDISYTDLAGLDAKGVDYGSSVAPKAFTVDKTAPKVSVSYSNNNSVNGNYYSAGRIATIVIDEHNFNMNRVDIDLSASNDGTGISAPAVSTWSTSGDRHTATINYSSDALYSFDIAFRDLAGNESTDYKADSFYIDNTDPSLEISNIENNSANGDVVQPVVTYSDTNIADCKITLSGANRGSVAPIGSYTDIHNGRMFSFADFVREAKIDDIYTLTATVTDKAGRTTTKNINFSVNRFGSVYALSDATKTLNGSFVKEEKDVVISEVNANELSGIEVRIFKNGEEIVLKKDVDYKIDIKGGNGAWYEYTYTVFAKNFADDGVYRVTVYSEDAAGNIAENTLDTKETEISFGVDKTAPTINMKTLESGVTYALDNIEALFAAADNLKLVKLTVTLDGTQCASWTDEALDTILETGDDFMFAVDGNSTEAHHVKILAVDAAGNEFTEEITDFFVTTNLWVRYYNNKAAFYGSIAAAIAITGLIVFWVVWKRRKEEKKA